MRNTFINELTKLAKQDPNVILITGDLGFGVFEEFEKLYPNQFLNAGVAEQNMSMLAAGMAMEGKKIYTYSIGNFPTLRCLEQIRNDICYHDLDVTVVCIGGGFSYGQLGMSHHATEDLSILRALPNMKVTAPGTLQEVRGIVRELYRLKGPSYLRLDKSDAKIDSYLEEIKFGKASLIKEGSDITLISSGGILEELILASDSLKNIGIDCRILSMHTIKPLDGDSINKAIKETGGIVTVEENNLQGGLGSSIAEYCLDNQIFPKLFKRIGMKDEYSSVVGDQHYLRKYYKMSSDCIFELVKSLST